MIVTHCGLQRTGTSSFQASLARQRKALGRAGIDYPEKWTSPGSNAHYGLASLLEPSAERTAALEGFRRYLASGRPEAVLLSSESLATWLSPEKWPALLNLLRVAQSERRICCIWTLRPADEFLTSLYLHQVMFGYEVPSVEDYFRQNAVALGRGMEAIRELEDALGVEFVYFRYEPDGRHHAQILDHVGVPERLRNALVAEMRIGPRLNPSLSRKGAAATLHRDAISARAGVEVERFRLRELLYRDGFRFEGDGPCVLVDGEVRRGAHELALDAAKRCGFAPYVEFFERHQVRAAVPTRTDPDILSHRDIDRLAAAVSPGRDERSRC